MLYSMYVLGAYLCMITMHGGAFVASSVFPFTASVETPLVTEELWLSQRP